MIYIINYIRLDIILNIILHYIVLRHIISYKFSLLITISFSIFSYFTLYSYFRSFSKACIDRYFEQHFHLLIVWEHILHWCSEVLTPVFYFRFKAFTHLITFHLLSLLALLVSNRVWTCIKSDPGGTAARLHSHNSPLTFTRLSWVFIDFMALFIAFFGFMSAQLGAFGFHDSEVWQFAFSAPTPKERRTRRWIFQGESWLSWKWNMWKWREKNIKNCTILYLVWESLLGIRKVSKSAKWKVWRNGSMWELHIRHHWVHSGCQLRHDHPCGML